MSVALLDKESARTGPCYTSKHRFLTQGPETGKGTNIAYIRQISQFFGLGSLKIEQELEEMLVPMPLTISRILCKVVCNFEFVIAEIAASVRC